jgi:hypothetical protein
MVDGMASRHLTLRLNADTLDKLDAESRRAGQTRSELARTLLEEGLRMEAHPGIVFRPGPAGRRPGLASGPDVWEIARVFRDARDRGEDIIEEAAELTGLTPDQIRTAIRYYVAYPEEIDSWISRVDAEAEEAEAVWRREQEYLTP